MNNTTANMPLKDSLKPSPLALLPIGVFLVIYAGSGIIFHDFYNMPAIIAFLAALLTAFLQTRTLSFSEKITVIAKGLADENIITMCLIFLTAGAFSGAVSAATALNSGLVKTKTCEKTDAEVYENWYKAVYMPNLAAAVQSGKASAASVKA